MTTILWWSLTSDLGATKVRSLIIPVFLDLYLRRFVRYGYALLYPRMTFTIKHITIHKNQTDLSHIASGMQNCKYNEFFR